MFKDIATYLASEASVVSQAPATFLMAVLVVGGTIWWALDWRYSGTVETLRERLSARNELLSDYKTKLSGASPDEAKARIDDLETRLAKLEPRRLSNDESQAIRRKLRGTTGKLEILIDAASASVRPFADDLAAAFRGAGWGVRTDLAVQFIPPAKSGLYVVVPDLNQLSQSQSAVFAALNEAGLAHEGHGGLSQQAPPHERDARIMVTPPD